MKTYDSTLLAKFLLSVAHSKYQALNMTKLQKLMYIIYGYYLSSFQHKIINEKPQAWPFGPVFARVHKHIDYTQILRLDDPELVGIAQDAKLKDVLERVVENYAGVTASQLSNWSHKDRSPWKKTTEQKNFKWSRKIPDEWISDYFSTYTIV
jgi:uncharacterized phage-associated protein